MRPATMNAPPEKKDTRLMRAMFHTIAPRYDFITRAFSFGMDRGWKRGAVDGAALAGKPLVLDLACGTGDFSRLVENRNPRARAVAADLTHSMLCHARRSGVQRALCADAMRLPFPSEIFDAVFVGYGLRNFPRLEEALSEIRRVLRPGGRVVSLDFFLPANAAWRALYLGYLYAQGVFWGFVLHRSPRTYTYIPDSLRSFVSAGEFCSILRRTGYHDVRAQTFVLGGIALHWAVRER